MRSKTGATLVLVLIFLMGGVTGGVSVYLYHQKIMAKVRLSLPPNSEGVLSFLTKYLELDAGQLEQLKKIVADSRDRYVALSQQYKPQTEAIRVETDQQIKQILRPDQAAKYEQFILDLQKRRQEASRSYQK